MTPIPVKLPSKGDTLPFTVAEWSFDGNERRLRYSRGGRLECQEWDGEKWTLIKFSLTDFSLFTGIPNELNTIVRVSE